jgi:hypothetical protein
MKIDQLSREYELESTVLEVVALTEKESGKEIDFELLVNLDVAGVTKIARERMPKHIMRIKESSPARVNHIIVHECGHILRMMRAKPAERVVPSSNTETSIKALFALKGELLALPESAREEMLELWTTGLINQLVNLPVDVRIERWIYHDYPAFREIQSKSLAVDVQSCLLGLSDKIRKNTIESIFNKSNALVYAYLRGITTVTGEDYIEAFKKYPDIKKIGRKLYRYLKMEDEGFAQDVNTINAWAEIIEIKSWFAWIGFEDVPETYFLD